MSKRPVINVIRPSFSIYEGFHNTEIDAAVGELIEILNLQKHSN